MGSALVMMTVPEELIGMGTLYRDERGHAIPICARGGAERARALRTHADAFFMLRVPYTAVWQPPAEPWEKHGTGWHWTPALRRAHRAKVGRSLEAFVNGHLRLLDGMVRTGWWILKRVRMRVSSLTEMPHAKDERRRRGATGATSRRR